MDPLSIYKTLPNAFIPEISNDGSVGYDIKTPTAFFIQPRETLKIDSGIAFEMNIHQNYFPKIFDKSSIAANKHCNVQGGVIDPNYRGSIIVALRNNGKDIVHFQRGDSIAQIVFLYYALPAFVEIYTIDVNTERGTRGFGGE